MQGMLTKIETNIYPLFPVIVIAIVVLHSTKESFPQSLMHYSEFFVDKSQFQSFASCGCNFIFTY